MNIIYSSTLDWNPGDELIWFAVRDLIESTWPGPHNYFHYNRNPENFASPFHSVLKPHLRSQSLAADELPHLVKHTDLIVQAGSPEWRGKPLKALHAAMATYAPDVPYLCFAVGNAATQSPQVNAQLLKLLLRTQTLWTTREKAFAEQTNSALETRNFLNYQICPGLLSAPFYLPDGAEKLLFLQSPSTVFAEQAVNPTTLKGYQEGLKSHKLCHVYKSEFYVYNGLGHLLPNGEEVLEALKDASEVVTTRLHVGLAALGMGKAVKFIASPDNYRIRAALWFLDSRYIHPNVETALAGESVTMSADAIALVRAWYKDQLQAFATVNRDVFTSRLEQRKREMPLSAVFSLM